MLRSHAKIVLKALQFWRFTYNDKYLEWRQIFRDADEARVNRRRHGGGMALHFIIPANVIGQNRVDGDIVDSNGNTADEGYQSGIDSDSE
jgi:hypothetical protein